MMQKPAKNVTQRGRGRPGDTQLNGAELLLKSAQRAFALDGFAGASVRKISEAAGFDSALAAYHFGSKEDLWKAVIAQMEDHIAMDIVELRKLHEQKDLPIRERTEKALRLLVKAVCEDPDSGMFLAKVSGEQGARLDYLVETLLRPYHDALVPLLKDAMKTGVIAKQPIEMFYFMLINAVLISVSYRHVLAYFGKTFDEMQQVQRETTNSVLSTFLTPAG